MSELIINCQYCERPAELVTGDVLYPHRPDLHERFFWRCEDCGAYVGTHVNSPEHSPLGTLANAHLRAMRREVHEMFDPLWKNKSYKINRHDAYQFLATAMGIPMDECHIGMFDLEQCALAMGIVMYRLPMLKDQKNG